MKTNPGYLPELNRVLIEGNPLRTLRRTLFSAPISEFKKFLRTRGDPPAWLLALEDGKGACVRARVRAGLCVLMCVCVRCASHTHARQTKHTQNRRHGAGRRA